VSDAVTPRAETGSGWYVYGVVPAAAASDELLTGTTAIDASGAVAFVADGELAAITSVVPLAEFGEAAIKQNLHDGVWLEQKVTGHEAVLETALARAPLVPFRFGTIYRGEEQVRQMLRANAYLSETLQRLRGTVELGVKAFLDPEEFERGQLGDASEEPGDSGRAYLLRKQRDRQLAEARAAFTAVFAQESHDRLAAAAEDARANPVQRPEVSGGEMILNGAYLVRSDREEAFRTALATLQSINQPEGVRYELTGPWPPYNFVDVEPEQ
jgi:Gas vesicle synthesis protein GvpL/GvpF